MNDHDQFHPDLTATTDVAARASLRTRVNHVKAGELALRDGRMI
jgi:hypothetical protein